EPPLLRQLPLHHHAGGCPVGELAGIACRDDAAGKGRLDLRDRLYRGVRPDPFVSAQRHLARGEAARPPVREPPEGGGRGELLGRHAPRRRRPPPPPARRPARGLPPAPAPAPAA